MSTAKKKQGPGKKPLSLTIDIGNGGQITIAERSNRLLSCAQLINSAISNIAVHYVEIGRTLLAAREMFTGDLEFGRWRMENTVIQSSQTALGLMNVAKHFGNDADLLQLPKSTLVALCSAPPRLIEEVREEVREGKNPTRQDIQQRKEDERNGNDATALAAAKRRRMEAEHVNQSVVPNRGTDRITERLNNTLALPLELRMKDEYASHWVKFGINDQCDGDPCSIEVVRLLHAAYTDGLTNDKLNDQIEKAYTEILAHFNINYQGDDAL